MQESNRAGLHGKSIVQFRKNATDGNRRRVRIDKVTMRLKQPGIRYAVQVDGAFASRLCKIDREVRESGAAGYVGTHDFRAAGEKCDIDVVECVRRNDLCDLNLACELLQQTGVLFRLEKRQPAHGQTARFNDFLHFFP